MKTAVWVVAMAATVSVILVIAYTPGIFIPVNENVPQLQTGGQVKNTLTVGEEGFFRGLASGGEPPYQFEWVFPDGTIINSMNATKAFDSPGMYEIGVSITDAAGQSGSHSFEIQVIPSE